MPNFQHPLVRTKISKLRDQNTNCKEFRELIRDLSLLLGVWATEDLDLVKIQQPLQSPMGSYEGVQLKNNIGLFPILRAGVGMVDGLLQLIPEATVHHLGLYREKKTLLPVEYYNKLPAQCSLDLGIVLDPMVATAGTAIATINILKDWGLKNIKFICILASQEGLDALMKHHPDVAFYCAQVDEELTDEGYIVPGLGDAGDRLFATHH